MQAEWKTFMVWACAIEVEIYNSLHEGVLIFKSWHLASHTAASALLDVNIPNANIACCHISQYTILNIKSLDVWLLFLRTSCWFISNCELPLIHSLNRLPNFVFSAPRWLSLMQWRTSKNILSPCEKLASSETWSMQDRLKARIGIFLGLKLKLMNIPEICSLPGELFGFYKPWNWWSVILNSKYQIMYYD